MKIIEWASQYRPWYKFWDPRSGMVGGFIFGSIAFAFVEIVGKILR